jgi:RHS repeat-associated protein
LISRYVWQDQLRLAAELNADGSMKKQFVYADGVNSPEYMIFDGKRYFFVKDHRGSINLVVNVDSGEVVQKMSYSEFGEVIEDTNPGFQPFGFAGGLYDTDTKLVKFGARDYDGKIGRWLSKDPIRFNGGDSNLYGYVLNDPINLIDPLGLQPELDPDFYDEKRLEGEIIQDFMDYILPREKNIRPADENPFLPKPKPFPPLPDNAFEPGGVLGPPRQPWDPPLSKPSCG